MNIVKFRDIILNGENNIHNLSDDKVNLFNEKLKGKYAYAINWKYVVPLNDITIQKYVDISTINNIDIPYIELMDIAEFMDNEETLSANSVDSFIKKNEKSTDSNITLDELKVFRPWLANRLLNSSIEDESIKMMLSYYNFDDTINKNGAGMYDNVIKQLTVFGKTELTLNNVLEPSCGCSNNINTSTFINKLESCDPIAVYRKNIYHKMVETFSNMDFWISYKNTGVIEDIISYISNIIKLELPLYSSQYTSNYVDCGCLNDKNIEQKTNTQILKNFKNSLEMILNNNIENHKNHIKQSLTKWASILYERMYWL